MTEVFRTARLFARPWEAADLDLAATLWGDPRVMTYIDVRGGLTRAQLEEKLRTEMRTQQEHGMQYWPLFELAGGGFVGCCGLKPWAWSPQPGPEMGFHLIPARWGQGYAREAAEGVIRHAFQDRGLPQLMAGHHPDNAGARKILTALGFRFLEDVLYKPTGRMHPSYELRNPGNAGNAGASSAGRDR
jgi:[ribosomal protein S5]-alanine N-acetyltransferase